MNTPRKVFILKNDEYIELTLQEHEVLQKTMPGYPDKKFVFLHDCLMEVSESFYTDFYKDKRRQKYLDECAAQYGAISYDMLSTDDFNGEDILIDHDVDVAEEVAESMMMEKLRYSKTLSDSLAGYVNADDQDEDHGTKIKLKQTELVTIKQIADAIGYIETHRSKIPAGQADCGRTLRKTLLSFERQNNKNVWLATDENGSLVLYGTEKKIGEMLHKVLWDKFSSHVLTSGTMSDGTNFDFFCYENGLDRISRHLMQISDTASPFDYKEHARLYIPKNMPYPNKDDPDYIRAVADQILELVKATNGHTAILFTSYKVLNAVYELTKDRLPGYDVICMTRSNKTAIADFKKSKNGVLFASGSMWEGVDCRGDSLSSVIIVRLPFPMRSVESEQKKDDCENMRDFIRKHALPEMLIKLRQGVGRLIRSENDTGVISILDCRANEAYRDDIDHVMSKYPKVTSVGEIEAFFKGMKTDEYWG